MKEYPEHFFTKKHIKTHPSEPKWDIIDQLMLLEALEKWKYGNWNDVKESMEIAGTKLTTQEIWKHFEKNYNLSED